MSSENSSSTNPNPNGKLQRLSREGSLTEATPLTASEKKALAKAEEVIQHGMTSFLEVGHALMEIRDNRLYRVDFATFAEYCRVRWGFSKSHANRHIAASGVADIIAEIDPENVPQVESQLRPLTRLTKAQIKKFWPQLRDAEPDLKNLRANTITRRAGEWGYLNSHLSVVSTKTIAPGTKKTLSRAVANEINGLLDEWLTTHRSKIPNAAELVSEFKKWLNRK